MNQHTIQVFSGQIKFLYDFFKDYKDDHVRVKVKQLNKIDLLLTVETNLSGEETAQYLKNVFKKLPYGSALHYSVKFVPE